MTGPLCLRATRRVSFWLLAILTLVALVFGGLAVVGMRDASRLARDGVEAQGTVVEMTERTRFNTSGGRNTSYRATVRFQTPDGRSVDVRHTVDLGVFLGIRVGSPMRVRYWPTDPRVSELRRGDTGFASRVLAAIAGLSALGAAVAGLVMWCTIGSQHRALLRGEARRARVHTRVAEGKLATAYVVVEWVDSAGVRGRSDRMPPGAPPAVGDEVGVRIDPRTGRAWLARDLGLSD